MAKTKLVFDFDTWNAYTFTISAMCLVKGVTFPCNHAIWAKWAPALERSTLITMAIAGEIHILFYSLCLLAKLKIQQYLLRHQPRTTFLWDTGQ